MGEQPVSPDTYTHARDRSRLEAGRPSMRMQPAESTSCASDGLTSAAVWTAVCINSGESSNLAPWSAMSDSELVIRYGRVKLVLFAFFKVYQAATIINITALGDDHVSEKVSH